MTTIRVTQRVVRADLTRATTSGPQVESGGVHIALECGHGYDLGLGGLPRVYTVGDEVPCEKCEAYSAAALANKWTSLGDLLQP